MKKFLFSWIMLFAGSLSIAQQNLVPNPSFEEYIECPNGLSCITEIKDITIKDWIRPNHGTPDGFNVCSTINSNATVPNNIFGYQYPRTGNGYAGGAVYANAYYPLSDSFSHTNGKEYIQVQLKEKLVRGESYCVSFYVSPAANIQSRIYQFYHACSNMGAYLSKDKIALFDDPNLPFLLLVTPQIQNPSGQILSDTAGWTQVKGIYEAQGGEEWITIGCFTDDSLMSLSLIYQDTNAVFFPDSYISYYYIDDVSVIPLGISGAGLSQDTVVCEGLSFLKRLMGRADADSFLWNTGATTLGIEVAEAGLYWVESRYGECGSVRDSIEIKEISLPSLWLAADTAFCEGETVTLQSPMGFGSYLWNTGATTPNLEVRETGLYILAATHACGTARDSIQITVHPIPPPPQVRDTSFCENQIVGALNATGNQLLWYTPTPTSTPPTPTTSLIGNQTYGVSQTLQGCESELAFLEVRIDPLPTIQLETEVSLCEGSTITLGKPAEAGYEYSWSNGENTPQIEIATAGSYILTLRNSCGQIHDTTAVLAYDCQNCIFFPNAFSPNNDGKNDEFAPVVNCPLLDYYFAIYDRWGNQIFTSSDPNTTWKGQTPQSKDLPEGVYFYQLHCQFLSQNAWNRSGTITLVR